MNLYEILGVEPTAPPEKIKAAYRKIMSECHPDREGGDPERAKEAGEAYATLSDPERRARYDATGSFNVEEDLAVRARGLIRAIFTDMLHKHVLSECQSPYFSPFDMKPTEKDKVPNFHLKVVGYLNLEIGTFNNSEKDNNKAIKVLKRMLNSIIRKGGEEDEIFNPIIKDNIEKAEALNKEIEAKRAPFTAAVELMKNGFEFNAPEPDPYPDFGFEKNPGGKIFIGA